MNKIIIYTSTFDKNDRLLTKSKSIQYLNDDDKIVKIEHFTEEKTLNSVVEIEYHNGFVIKEVETAETGEKHTRSVERNEFGRKVYESIKTENGTKLYEFILDATKNEAKELEFNHAGNIIAQTTCIFNDKNLKIQEVEAFGTTNYSYDSQGNLIYSEVVENGEITIKENHEYIDNKEVLYKGIDIESQEEVTIKKAYNHLGKIITEVQTVDEEIVTSSQYEYDEKDRLVSIRTSSWEEIVVTEYIYE